MDHLIKPVTGPDVVRTAAGGTVFVGEGVTLRALLVFDRAMSDDELKALTADPPFIPPI